MKDDWISREQAKKFLYEKLDRLNDDELYDIFSRIIDDMYNELPPVVIPKALSGACFHGEVWVKCPHCKSGNEMMGKKELYKQDGYSIYKCDECGKLFKDR